MAIPMEGKYSESELLELKNKMNAKALAKRRSKTALRLAANIIFAILVLLPLLYAVSIALMPSNELFTTDLNLFPKHPTLQNFKEAFTTVPLLRFILNSFIMAGCITIGQIISCSLAAFAFSFLEFKGKGILFAIVMATMMVPGEATIISNYLTVGSWGILDTYAVLIIPYLTSAMGIFLFRQFYLTFPKSLYEAAKIDGASAVRTFFSVTLPLLIPSLTINVTQAIIGGFRVFEQVLTLTDGGPGHQSTVVSMMVYEYFGRGFYGKSTAISMMLSVIVLFVTLAVRGYFNKKAVSY